jgi:hypothetical protein
MNFRMTKTIDFCTIQSVEFFHTMNVSKAEAQMAADMQEKIGINDVTQAAGVLCGTVAAVGLVYGQFSAVPGFVWPALVAVAASAVELGRRCWSKPAPASTLAKLTPTYVSTAVGAVIFAFVMPALFPDGAYERARWLVWIDAILLLGGLLAVPTARLTLTVAARLARRRHQQGLGNDARD